MGEQRFQHACAMRYTRTPYITNYFVDLKFYNIYLKEIASVANTVLGKSRVQKLLCIVNIDTT